MNLFTRDDDVDSHGCPIKDKSKQDIVPLVNGMTFHTLAMIIAGACTAFATLVSVVLIMDHAFHFSNPREQTLIMRIILMLPLCGVIAFACVALDSAALYLKPGIEVVESLALACFFLLMLAYIYPDDDMGHGLFEKLDLRPTKKKGKMKWYKQCFIGIFQFPPISILIWAVTAITLAAGRFCESSNNPKFAHIWMTILRTMSTCSTLASLFITYGILKAELKPYHALSKFVTFKLIIFFNFFQTTIFSLLVSSNTIKPTKYLTFNNMYFALPNLILCIEMAFIAPLFAYAYPAKPYYRKNRPNGFANYYASSSYGIKALWSVINISDLLRGLVFAVQFYMAAFRDGGSAGRKYSPDPVPSRDGMDNERTAYDRWRYENIPSNGFPPYGHLEDPYRPGSGRVTPLAHTRGDSRSEMYPLRG